MPFAVATSAAGFISSGFADQSKETTKGTQISPITEILPTKLLSSARQTDAQADKKRTQLR